MVEVQTPKQIVEKLDQYVIGQDEAKRAILSLKGRCLSLL